LITRVNLHWKTRKGYHWKITGGTRTRYYKYRRGKKDTALEKYNRAEIKRKKIPTSEFATLHFRVNYNTQKAYRNFFIAPDSYVTIRAKGLSDEEARQKAEDIIRKGITGKFGEAFSNMVELVEGIERTGNTEEIVFKYSYDGRRWKDLDSTPQHVERQSTLSRQAAKGEGVYKREKMRGWDE
jgi:hypothetical protein